MNEAQKKLLVEKAAKFGLTIDATTDYTKLASQVEELEVKAEITAVAKAEVAPTAELVKKMDERMGKLEAAAASFGTQRESDRTKNVYKGFKVNNWYFRREFRPLGYAELPPYLNNTSPIDSD